jgi:hypothetical protein
MYTKAFIQRGAMRKRSVEAMAKVEFCWEREPRERKRKEVSSQVGP